MTHIDLFSGIGGFAYAVDKVFHEQTNNHIFVEIDPFCQAVLRKHWPCSPIISDIRSFTDTRSKKQRGLPNGTRQKVSSVRVSDQPFLLTGGFPCQPFSQAGKRHGTKDDRHLWPEMHRVIRLTKPEWVIAENVRGLLTIGGGLVFEQVCTDLESAGYEVQPLIIPAVSLNAPHRRDRIWFIAHASGNQHRGRTEAKGGEESLQGVNRSTGFVRGTGGADQVLNATNTRHEHGSARRDEEVEEGQTKRTSRITHSERRSEDVADTERTGHKGKVNQERQSSRYRRRPQFTGWSKDWTEVAADLCRMDDGVPKRMDRNPRLKALGNAIVPQVAMQILQAIKQTTVK